MSEEEKRNTMLKLTREEIAERFGLIQDSFDYEAFFQALSTIRSGSAIS